jgi:exonuclease 3'-5' domain-containing protein 1
MTENVLCADDSSLTDAVTILQRSTTIIIDCEGYQLGCADGKLSIISLRAIVPVSSKIFLIDTIALGADSLGPLFGILQLPSITKVVFDGRMDFTELYHTYGVKMEGVLDIQLVDIASRSRRGERLNNQLRRLSPFLDRFEISTDRPFYAHIHKLCGLSQSLREHQLIRYGQDGKAKCKETSSVEGQAH